MRSREDAIHGVGATAVLPGTAAALRVVLAAFLAWLRTLRRRWHFELGQAALLITAVGVTAHALGEFAALSAGRTGGDTAQGHVTAVYLLALTAAAAMPASAAGSRLLITPRLDLLPLPAPTRFALRTLLLNPLRLIVSAAAGAMVGAVVLRHAASWSVAALETVQMAAAAVAVISLADMVDQLTLRVRWLPARGALLAAGSLALLLLVHDGGASAGAVLHARVPTGLLLGGERASAAEVVVTVVAGSISLVMLVLARRTPTPRTTTARAGRGRPRSHALHRAHGRIARWTGVLLARELAVVLRHPRILLGLLWPAALCMLAFVWGVPLFLAAAGALWGLQALNLFGPDMPGAGMTRYELLPGGVDAVARMRHSAFLLAFAVCMLAVWVGAYLLGAVRVPVMGPGSLWMYAVAGVYSLSVYMAFAAASRRVALDWPHWYDGAARLRLGEEPPAYTTLVVLLGAATVMAGAMLAGVAVTAALAPVTPAVRSAVLLGTAAAVHAACGFVAHRQRA